MGNCKRAMTLTLHWLLLDKLRESGQLDFSYAAFDSSSLRAVGACQNWAKRHRSRATGVQTPRPCGRERCSCQRDRDRREPQRPHATASAGRRYPTNSRHSRPAASQAQGRLRRPRRRLRLAFVADFASVASDRSSPGAAPNTAAV